LLYRLSGCQIKQGVSKLLSSLKATSLKELDLQYNDFENIMEKKIHQLKAKLRLPRYSSIYFVFSCGSLV